MQRTYSVKHKKTTFTTHSTLRRIGHAHLSDKDIRTRIQTSFTGQLRVLWTISNFTVHTVVARPVVSTKHGLINGLAEEVFKTYLKTSEAAQNHNTMTKVLSRKMYNFSQAHQFSNKNIKSVLKNTQLDRFNDMGPHAG